ncbi:MAG: hypothetical protein OXT74_04770 [Candidatus Poribacteria bacterium]|nr:hypothetical protein [Candidatus Poribacteria bacterium]
MKLTQEQLDFFDTFGYLMIPQLFSKDETDGIIDVFEWSIQNCGGGENHDGSTRTMFLGPIERHPEMCRLLDHPAILDLIGGVLGEDFNYCSGDGNYYSGDTGWHPDGGWGQLSPPRQRSISIHLLVTPGHCGSFRVLIDPTISCVRKKSM